MNLPQCEIHKGRLALETCGLCGRPCCLSCAFRTPRGVRCPIHLEAGPPQTAFRILARFFFFGFSLLPLVGLFLGGFLILRGWPQDKPLGRLCLGASVLLYMILPILVLAFFGATGLGALISFMLPA